MNDHLAEAKIRRFEHAHKQVTLLEAQLAAAINTRNLLAATCNDLGISKRTLARRIGLVHGSTVTRWIQGTRT